MRVIRLRVQNYLILSRDKTIGTLKLPNLQRPESDAVLPLFFLLLTKQVTNASIKKFYAFSRSNIGTVSDKE